MFFPKPIDFVGKTMVCGNFYPVKDLLVDLGGMWDPIRCAYWVPESKADMARDLILGVSCPNRNYSCELGVKTCNRCKALNTRKWVPCGYPGCNPTACEMCDGLGVKGTYDL